MASRFITVQTYAILALHVPNYGLVEHEKHFIELISEDNQGFIPGLWIISVGWLIPDWADKKGYGNLLLEVGYPKHANAAIRDGLIIIDNVYACEYYDDEAQPQQCFYCQQYSHVEEDCHATSPVCAHCAGNHRIVDCAVKKQGKRYTRKCAVCHGSHRSFDSSCAVRQSLLDDARSADAHRATYHLVDGEEPNAEWWPDWEVPSRKYAGRLRYSIDFLKEIERRHRRKSHAHLRDRGGRSQGVPPPLKASEEQIIIERCLKCVTSPEGRPCPLDPSRRYWGIRGRALVESEVYNNPKAFRERLISMGIEPYTSKQLQAEKEIGVKYPDAASRITGGEEVKEEKDGSDWRKTSTPCQKREPLKSPLKSPDTQQSTPDHHLGFGIDKIRPPSDVTAHKKTERSAFEKNVAIDKILSQKSWR